jgi:hypothetical protein
MLRRSIHAATAKSMRAFDPQRQFFVFGRCLRESDSLTDSQTAGRRVVPARQSQHAGRTFAYAKARKNRPNRPFTSQTTIACVTDLQLPSQVFFPWL